MELNNLKKPVGSTHLPKRVGLGIGSGMGKISTRGQKGEGARQGQKFHLVLKVEISQFIEEFQNMDLHLLIELNIILYLFLILINVLITIKK